MPKDFPVQLPPEIAKKLARPICADIALPKPGKGKITLPTGGSIAAVVDATKQIPDDCSVNFSLLLQLGPILAPMKCILAVLGLIGPLIEIVKGLPFPPAKAIADFIKAAGEVTECITQIFGAGMFLFLRDILLLIIKLLNCFIGQLETILGVMANLAIRVQGAENNPELQAVLGCAQENAQNGAEAAMMGFEPILVILELVGPIVEQFVGQTIEIPDLTGGVENTGKLEEMIATLKEFQAALQTVADAIPGG
jgi:hypothetical protein